VIVVRNELVYELPPEKQMLAQRWLTQRTNQEAKPLFLQSQVLESMVDSAGCTRNEANDISQAVLEGTDVLILSHETSVGKHSVEAVIQLSKSISEAESIYDHEQAFADVRAD